ncbi:MAG: phospholipase [Acidobacteria bacterium]|nr:MAG: phospholipase [Acidobacteriota bacterium]
MGRPQSRFIAAGVHGRYLMDAPAGPGPHPLLVGFHGYKENAEAHLEQLQRVPGAARFVLVAVQSLHLFYSKSGDVVGSWMTRLGREHAIEDNVRYVGAVVAEVKRHLPAAGGLVYAGFSQGASMAYRAAARAGHACDGLVALGGDMPPEIADDLSTKLPPVLIGRGEGDEWFTREKLELDLGRLARLGVSARSVVFAGRHEWTDEFRAAMGEFLSSIRLPRNAAP